jgi:hypothetical protein
VIMEIFPPCFRPTKQKRAAVIVVVESKNGGEANKSRCRPPVAEINPVSVFGSHGDYKKSALSKDRGVGNEHDNDESQQDQQQLLESERKDKDYTGRLVVDKMTPNASVLQEAVSNQDETPLPRTLFSVKKRKRASERSNGLKDCGNEHDDDESQQAQQQLLEPERKDKGFIGRLASEKVIPNTNLLQEAVSNQDETPLPRTLFSVKKRKRASKRPASSLCNTCNNVSLQSATIGPQTVQEAEALLEKATMASQNSPALTEGATMASEASHFEDRTLFPSPPNDLQLQQKGLFRTVNKTSESSDGHRLASPTSPLPSIASPASHPSSQLQAPQSPIQDQPPLQDTPHGLSPGGNMPVLSELPSSPLPNDTKAPLPLAPHPTTQKSDSPPSKKRKRRKGANAPSSCIKQRASGDWVSPCHVSCLFPPYVTCSLTIVLLSLPFLQQCKVYFMGKYRDIGMFDTKAKAILAYDIALETLLDAHQLQNGKKEKSPELVEAALNVARISASEGVSGHETKVRVSNSKTTMPAPVDPAEIAELAETIRAVSAARGGKNSTAAKKAAAILRGVSQKPSGKWVSLTHAFLLHSTKFFSLTFNFLSHALPSSI